MRDFGHATIAPVDQRLPRDAFDRSSGTWSLRFPAWCLGQQWAQHRELFSARTVHQPGEQNRSGRMAWVSCVEKS